MSESGSAKTVQNLDIVAAFTTEHAAQLSGLSTRRLIYWDRTGFFSPRYRDGNDRHPYSRIYSFRDVVGLRILNLLRTDHGVSLQQLRQLGAWFGRRYEAPWSELRFYVIGRNLYYDDPESGKLLAARPVGQTAMPFDLIAVVRDVRDAAEGLRRRAPDEIALVRRHRHVLGNRPVLAGTRVPTAAVWEFHEAGHSADDIIHEFPRLTKADVKAAIEYEREQRQARAG